MTKPNKVQDLHVAGLVSEGDVGRIASSIFDGVETVHDIDGYVVTLPKYEELPDSCQQFIRKALMFSAVRNVLDHDEVGEQPFDEEVSNEYTFKEDD